MDPVTSVVLFVFGSIGLTHLLVDSAIFAPMRDFLQVRLWPKVYKIFECYQCCGVWVGFLTGLLVYGIPLILVERYYAAVVATIVSGWAASFLAYGGAAMLSYLEANSVISPSEDK